MKYLKQNDTSRQGLIITVYAAEFIRFVAKKDTYVLSVFSQNIVMHTLSWFVHSFQCSGHITAKRVSYRPNCTSTAAVVVEIGNGERLLLVAFNSKLRRRNG